MGFIRIILSISLLSVMGVSFAGHLTKDAAIGGALGGAVGGAIGAEAGGRNGAILGSAAGAALGTAIASEDGHPGGHQQHRPEPHIDYRPRYEKHPQAYRHCPPGQAKKGRC